MPINCHCLSLLTVALCYCEEITFCAFCSSYLQNVRVCGQTQQFAGLAQANAMQGGQVVTAGEDAHIAKLLLCESIPQGATAAKVTLVYLQAISLLVHFEDHLHDYKM